MSCHICNWISGHEPGCAEGISDKFYDIEQQISSLRQQIADDIAKIVVPYKLSRAPRGDSYKTPDINALLKAISDAIRGPQ